MIGRRWAAVALLALTGCASSRPPAKADVATPSEPSAAPATVAAPEPRPLPRPGMPGLPGMAPPPGEHRPGPWTPAGGLPLVRPGESRTESEGCLALANPEQEGPTKAPPLENTRGLPGAGDGPEVAVRQTPAGVTILHGLMHNCCQKADVQTKVEASKVTVTETFSGDTCRCNCRSTLKTTVGLGPGDYTVEVVRIDAGGAPKTVYSGAATVRPMLVPRPKP